MTDYLIVLKDNGWKWTFQENSKGPSMLHACLISILYLLIKLLMQKKKIQLGKNLFLKTKFS